GALGELDERELEDHRPGRQRRLDPADELGVANDAEFVGRIEAALPAGSMVFQLPLIEFPEGAEPGTVGPYDLARAYLHSKSLRWSFGAMKGRYGDSWQKHAADRPVPEMLRTLAM